MRVAVTSFRGEAPRITPRALPENAAQDASNARLLTGDLEAWKQFHSEKVLANVGPVQTIYKLNGSWLSWDSDVDVARGAIAGDTTFRTFITGPGEYAEPRYTTYALATTGAEPFPVVTRPLGVPAPDTAPVLAVGVDSTATTFSVDVLDEGNLLSTNWVKSTDRLASTYSTVTQDSSLGNPAYKLMYDEIHNEGEQPIAYRNFGIGATAAIHFAGQFYCGMDTTFMQACFVVAANATATKAVQVGVNSATGKLFIGITTASFTPYCPVIDSITIPGNVQPTTWYDITADIVVNADGTATVTAVLLLAAVEVCRIVATGPFTIGDYVGLTNGVPDDSGSQFATWYDNIHVQASGSTNYSPVNIATSYVYVFANDLQQLSAPSPASATILRPDGVSVTITTPTTVPVGTDPDYGIETKRIYRAVTGASGTIFEFVAEIPLLQADYVDVLDDQQLGEALISELFDLPPADMRGMLALPNGVMAGFSKNQLCLSAQNYPHAWPVEYRLTVDTDIVAIGNIDTTVVIGTENFVYLAIGTDPAQYSMTKLEVPQACVAKRSLSYLTGIGVVFASPDGLIAVAGSGQIRNLTSSIFTREQWQALDPESIVAVAHDDVYWCFTYQLSFALDMKQDGFGLVPVTFHASAAFSDPLTDRLFLLLDENHEPTEAILPLTSTAPVVSGGVTIYDFNSEAGNGQMVYRWRGKLNLLPTLASFCYCQIKAADYTNLILRLYGDGFLLIDRVMTGKEPFTLPMQNEYESFEIEIIGTSRVYSVQVSEDIAELV